MFFGALGLNLDTTSVSLSLSTLGAMGTCAVGLTFILGLYQRIFSNTDQYTGHGLLMIFGLVFSLVVTAVQLSLPGSTCISGLVLATLNPARSIIVPEWYLASTIYVRKTLLLGLMGQVVLVYQLGSVFQSVLQASGVTQVILGLMASFLLSSCLMSVLLDYFVHGRSVVPVNFNVSDLVLHIVPEWYLLPVYLAVEQSMKACRLSMDTQLVLDLGLAVFAQQIVHLLKKLSIFTPRCSIL
jgi:hypothetical protein